MQPKEQGAAVAAAQQATEDSHLATATYLSLSLLLFPPCPSPLHFSLSKTALASKNTKLRLKVRSILPILSSKFAVVPVRWSPVIEGVDRAMAGTVGKGPASTPEDVPGEPTNVTSSLLGTGVKALQSLKPINRIHAHLCAFHFYAHDMNRQVEAHHYCTHYNQDMRQCLIYDSPEKNARLIGVEYIVSEKLFQGLPDEEKKLWHTHEYEVKGGILFLPGVPTVAEVKELDEVAKTYGKVFHFWQYDRGDTLPLGLPQLMMSFTEDGQLNPELASSVEKRFGVSFQDHAESRKHITGPSMGIHPLANPWQQGTSLQSELREVDITEKH